MTPNEVTAVNIGAAIRDGLRLKTVEVVALLHNACQQLESGSAAKLHRSIDDLWVTDAGVVVLPRLARPEPAREAVATLLEELLPKPGEGAAVPAALRTLPLRLRDSGNAKPSDLKDLLTILRWHLPADSREVLRDLVMRARLSKVEAQDDAPIDAFGAEGANPIPAAMPPASVPATTRRSHAGLAAAAALTLAVGAAGYATYRVNTPQPSSVAATAPSIAPAQAPPVEPVPGRITRADSNPRNAEASPRAAVVEARALNLPLDGGVFSPSFGANGTALVFHAGHNTSGQLFQASLDNRGRASAIAPLLDNRGRTYHARLAPDGQSVAFDSDRDGERGVYVASRDGANVARVSGDGFAAVPSWSPDMKWLAFVRAEESRPKIWNLWLRDVATGSMTRLSAFRSGQVWGASWFPDARSLCYSHEDRLIVTDLDSGSTRTFETPIKGRLIRTPAVSPDGKRIVFQVYRDGAWLLDVATGQMRKVLADPTAEEFAWDPDGKAIAYHSRRDGQWRIWMLTV